jgi:hypothetical protein
MATWRYRLRFDWSANGRNTSKHAARRRRAAVHQAERFANPAPVRVLRAEFVHDVGKDIEWLVETDANTDPLGQQTIRNLWDVFVGFGNVDQNSLVIEPLGAAP